jgi:type 1 glutamine amidotransferase
MNFSRHTFLALILAAACGFALPAVAAPKKLLVISITTGFRHSSIETGEKVLGELAAKSGDFTVDFVKQPEGRLNAPSKPKRDEKKDTDESFKAKEDAYAAAMEEFKPKNDAYNKVVKAYCADKLAMDKLKDYDGFVFCNTTGDLPFPDPQGFIDLVKGGKAFIATHSGSDTFHQFRPYIEMLGGEFETHHSQVEIEPIVHDRSHPAGAPFPEGFKVYDEIYIIKSFSKDNVHGILGLDAHPNDKTPGYYPVSWVREFGKGRVFYTSLGHREDVWDPTWKAGTPDRKNAPEIAEIYQKHLLGGIRWALRLVEGDAGNGGSATGGNVT